MTESSEQLARQEARFDADIVEIAVVTGPNGVTGHKVGAGHPLGADGLWTASIDVTAWVSLVPDSRQELHTKKAQLVRLVDESELAMLRESIRGDQIYTLQVRQGNGYLSPSEMTARNKLAEMGFTFDTVDEFLLVEILPHRDVAALEAVLAAQTTPQTFESSALGSMIEDRAVGWFTRRVPWLGREIEVSVTAASVPQMQKTTRTIATLTEDADTWQTGAAAFAAQELCPLYNESWREDTTSLDADEFASRLRLLSIHVGSDDGSFSLEFDDGAMFGGHSIHLDGSLNGTFTNAGI
ncbi:DUF2262 domain-containing protein [Microbacterium sp. NPDC056052]|uniref:DUF2262 domain-containing protein n=1 Tax=Microbacterium sp. NPDC056052 TaxID=3345695 RepID=UPI0035DF6827